MKITPQNVGRLSKEAEEDQNAEWSITGLVREHLEEK